MKNMSGVNIQFHFSGSGSYLMKNFERLVRGVWIPGSNEILAPTLYVLESYMLLKIKE